MGRRPLEQWLSRGDAVGKSFSRANASPRASSPRGENSPSGRQADAKFSPDLPSNLPINTEPFKSAVLTTTPAESYWSGDSSSVVVDAKLLNSMSAQEVRAFKNARPTNAPMSTTLSNSSVDRAATPSYNSQASSKLPLRPPDGKIAVVVDKKGPAATAPAIPGTNSDGVAKALSADSPVNSATTKNPATNSALPVPSSAAASVNPLAPNSAASAQRQVLTTTAPASLPNLNGNAAPGVAAKDTPPALSASNSAPPSAKPAAPLNPSAAARPVAPNSAPTWAPVTVQPPLRGVMKIARNTDQAFLLKLPAESVPSGQSTSLRMQRSVMVPQQSRWHHHGAIAKLTVGELLTQPPPEKPDAKIQPRPGTRSLCARLWTKMALFGN